ncbi:hypothetical protein IFM89_008491 [Coptis chinensis]|uniref:Uncharacterized protein n=1 Tax=Coptis chinensis TaxID=261450 RepID=A0A835H261_9MAGN|nr:hypothetical protein IFM89_008491 [Coptis chinensis]
MATTLLICLILADYLVVLAMATIHVKTVPEPKMLSFEDSLKVAPQPTQKLDKLQDFNKHQSNFKFLSFSMSSVLSRSNPKPVHAEAPTFSGVASTQPTETLIAEEHGKPNVQEASSSNRLDLTGSHNRGIEIAEAPVNSRIGRHHHSTDKSVAGGGVILGGLATTFFVSVFCYIRVTRSKSGEIIKA